MQFTAIIKAMMLLSITNYLNDLIKKWNYE